MFDDSSFQEIADHKKGFSHAKHDVVSDAEFCVLHDTDHYKAKYLDFYNQKRFSKAYYEGALEGIDAGMNEALS